MRKKKFFYLLLVLSLLATCVSCGKGKEENMGKENQEEENQGKENTEEENTEEEYIQAMMITVGKSGITISKIPFCT